jgi:hypothetical protein
LGFGDCFIFFIFNYKKIINNNLKIFTFTKFDKQIALFFFKKKRILNFFFYIPNFIIYKLAEKINKDIYFKKNLFFDLKKKRVLDSHQNLITKKLKKKIRYVSKNLLKLKDDRYIILFIKYYNDNINDLNASCSRQSNNFNKILKIINMIVKNNYKILVLGNSEDKSVPILKKIVKKNKINNVYFFSDISKNYSLIDQIYVNFYSQGSIGSDTGAFIISIFLKKKIIFFDTVKLQSSLFLEKNKNIKLLYKKINIKKKNKILTEDYFFEKRPKVIENSFEEIQKEFKKKFLEKTILNSI